MATGVSDFPTSLDTTSNQPAASTLASIQLDGDGTANNIHSNVHGVSDTAIVALETKLGTGATTPTATAVLVGSGSGTSAWDTTPTFGAVPITDDLVLGIGSNNDGAIVNRTTVLNANTALSGVTIGTPVTPAVAANSTIVSNVTASGDILIATNRGGNTEAHMWLDGSAGDTYLYARGVQMIKLTGGGGVNIAVDTIVADDKKMIFGDGSDVSLEYDEDGTDQLRITGNTVFANQVEATLDVMIDSTPADETVSGITATFTAGEALVRGEVCYFKAADSKMWQAVATAAAPSNCVAMAAADISADAAGLFLLKGFLADNGSFPAYTVAGTLYTPEAETSSQNVPEQAAPDTDGDFVQVLGWAVTANSVYFDPDSTIVEVS